jgi:hypothetical protein
MGEDHFSLELSYKIWNPLGGEDTGSKYISPKRWCIYLQVHIALITRKPTSTVLFTHN